VQVRLTAAECQGYHSSEWPGGCVEFSCTESSCVECSYDTSLSDSLHTTHFNGTLVMHIVTT
jgi:hypothetical protein